MAEAKFKKSNYEEITGQPLIEAPAPQPLPPVGGQQTPAVQTPAPSGFRGAVNQFNQNFPNAGQIPGAIWEGVKRGANQITDPAFYGPTYHIQNLANSDMGQAVDASMRSTFDDRGNVYGISDLAAQNITAAGGFMPSTPGAQTTADIIAENAVPPSAATAAGVDPGGQPNPFTDAQPSLRPSRSFTNIPGYAAETGALMTQYDEATGKNTYKDAQGNVVDPGFTPTDYAGGPSLKPFSPSATPGLTITDDPIAVAGTGGDAMTFRGTGQPATTTSGGGGGSITVSGQQFTEGSREHYNAQRQQTIQDLIDGGMTPGAARSLSKNITDKQLYGDPGIDIEAELLKDMPSSADSPEAAKQRRDILGRVARLRESQAATETARINAESAQRTSMRPAAGGRTAAQERLTMAEANLKELEADEKSGVKTDKLVRDEFSGKIIGGTMQAYGTTIDGADFYSFNQRMEERRQAIAALNPGADAGEVMRLAAREAAQDYAATSKAPKG
jgi:hypothetical protein